MLRMPGMQDTQLYTGILEIWRVDKVELHKDTAEVYAHVQWRPDTRFRCPECGKDCPGDDTQSRRWGHLDTCQYQTILAAEVPRVEVGLVASMQFFFHHLLR